MSSILKALKKLEQDKALRRPDTFRIDADILRSATPRRSSTAVVVAAVAIFACGAGATYLYLQPASPPTIGEAPREARIGAAAGPAATKSLPVGADPAVERSSDRTDREQVQRPEQATPVPDKPPSPPSHWPPDRPHQALRSDPAGSAERVAPPPQPLSPPAPPTPVASPVKPVLLKVHGIAFQDGADSVAVVNGVTVTKGSLIEDVRVEEILKDRVRFSRGGERFEIVLDKSN